MGLLELEYDNIKQREGGQWKGISKRKEQTWNREKREETLRNWRKRTNRKKEGRYNEKMKKMFFFVLNKYQSFYLHFSRRKEFEEKKEKGVVNT